MKKRKITIDYSDTAIGLYEFNAEILCHRHEIDGSETILLKTDPRESVKEFLHNEPQHGLLHSYNK